MTAASALVDTFATADTAKWNFPQAGITSTGGVLNLVPSASYTTLASIDQTLSLVGDQTVAQVVGVPNVGNGTTEFGWGFFNAAFTMDIRFFWSGNTLFAEYNIGAGAVQTTIGGWDPIAFAWQRLRESGGTTFWDTSPGNGIWTTQYSIANPFTLTPLAAFAVSGFYGTEPTPGAAQLDNWNLPPIPGAPRTQPYTARRRAANF